MIYTFHIRKRKEEEEGEEDKEAKKQTETHFIARVNNNKLSEDSNK